MELEGKSSSNSEKVKVIGRDSILYLKRSPPQQGKMGKSFSTKLFPCAVISRDIQQTTNLEFTYRRKEMLMASLLQLLSTMTCWPCVKHQKTDFLSHSERNPGWKQ